MAERQVCTRCVMDTSAAGIRFDAQGCCNYCTEFLQRWTVMSSAVQDRKAKRDALFAQVREAGKGRDYDCIVGVSGGVDSSYALHLAVKNGLRPLAVHLDNGWNSEVATNNIANLVSSLDVDLFTHVINWEENRDLQLAFMKAHVIDIELLMDNAMLAVNFSQAAKYGLKHILAGTNTATEGMRMPRGWNHYKYDVANIRNIAKQFGGVRIETHPLISTFDMIRYETVQKISWLPFLDYVDYVKSEALAILQKECDYKPYPYKHYESVFTRFYQGYILPRKFGVDKRRLHLSNLVMTGEMTRAEASKSLEHDPYPDDKQREKDRMFVIKKFGVTEEWFDAYMKAPPVPHSKYGVEPKVMSYAARAVRRLKRA